MSFINAMKNKGLKMETYGAPEEATMTFDLENECTVTMIQL